MDRSTPFLDCPLPCDCAPRHSAVHIAFCGCQHPVRERLESDVKYFSELAEASSKSFNAWRCIVSLGFVRHPAVQALRAELATRGDMNRRHSPMLAQILYHADSRTLHQPLLDPVVPGNDDDDLGGAGGGGGGGGAGATPEPGHGPAGPGVGSGPPSSGGGKESPPPGGPSGSTKASAASRSLGSSSNGSDLHDRLWCKAALGHLKTFEAQRQAGSATASLCTAFIVFRLWISSPLLEPNSHTPIIPIPSQPRQAQILKTTELNLHCV